MRHQSTAIYFSLQENILARFLFLSVVFLFSDFVSNVIPRVASRVQRSSPRACESRAALSAAARENEAASYGFAEEPVALNDVSPECELR